MSNNHRDAIPVAGFDLNPSSFLNDKTGAAQTQFSAAMQEHYRKVVDAGLSLADADLNTIASVRQAQAALFYQSPPYLDMRARYKVKVEGQTIAGVYTESFTPTEGVTAANQQRVLINLFGGGFETGSRTASHTESIPVAALGKIKVISVDYRLAPEHQFPAATEDVIAVYRALLKTYRPENIGIFGTSAGARLCAQVLAQLQQDALPAPGAVAMIAWSACAGEGDSLPLVTAIHKACNGYDLENARIQYLENTDPNDPLVTPGVSDAVMAKFPPSMLASSSRDWLMSSVTACHRQLCRLKVPAELHIWDGLEHNFHCNPALPETEELHLTTVQFFDRYLGVVRSEGAK